MNDAGLVEENNRLRAALGDLKRRMCIQTYAVPMDVFGAHRETMELEICRQMARSLFELLKQGDGLDVTEDGQWCRFRVTFLTP